MTSFAGAIFVGLVAGNAAHVILGRALVVMILSWLIGRLIGALAQHFVQQSIEQYKLANPIVDDEAELSASLVNNEEEEEVIDATPETFSGELVGGLPGSGSGQSV